MIRIPQLVLVLIQGALLFISTYAVFILIPTVSDELRTKLWINAENENIYIDKWDVIHWGSALLATLAWPDIRIQRIVAYSGFFVAVTFELYEQLYLCQRDIHKDSCEPWEDTFKDIITAVIGILVAIYNPHTVEALGLYETLFWTLALLILMPHIWIYPFILYFLIVYSLDRYYRYPNQLRIFFVFLTFVGVLIRIEQGNIDVAVLRSTLYALGGIMLVVVLVKALDNLAATDQNRTNRKRI